MHDPSIYGRESKEGRFQSPVKKQKLQRQLSIDDSDTASITAADTTDINDDLFTQYQVAYATLKRWAAMSNAALTHEAFKWKNRRKLLKDKDDQ